MILGTLILADWLIKLREGVLRYLGEKSLVLLASISAGAAIWLSVFYGFFQRLSMADPFAHMYDNMPKSLLKASMSLQ